jgi:hypothetical protein
MRRSFAIGLLLLLPSWSSAADTFVGSWETTYGTMTLVQNGDKISGSYDMDGQRSTIEGKLERNRFVFIYREPGVQGEGWFELSRDGKSFSGKWRAKGQTEWSDWTGTRSQQALNKANSFSGLWETSFGRMRLTQKDSKVFGIYSFNGGSTVEGTVSGGKLTLQYKEPSAQGQATFELAPDGNRFSGTWRKQDSMSGGNWTGERVQPTPGVAWLIVIEARWESSITDDEYSFGSMLRPFFARSSLVRVRHRFFDDEATLKRWCSEVAYTAEPAVLVIASHGSADGVAADGKTVSPKAIAEGLRYASNLKLLHFSACEVMKGKAAESIAATIDPSSRFPISGYRKSVDWTASAVIEFAYLDMILMRGMTPAKAAEQIAELMPFSGEGRLRKSAFGDAGFRLLKPDDVK